jgi:hypothetical protein
MSAPDLGKKYQGFYTDSRTQMVEAMKPIDKSDAYTKPAGQYLQNMTKAGTVDAEKNELERNAKMAEDKSDDY